jgi:hypothetical protein
LQSVDFNAHVVVVVADEAISGSVDRALLVLANATGKGIVVGDELDEGFEGGVIQSQEGERVLIGVRWCKL